VPWLATCYIGRGGDGDRGPCLATHMALRQDRRFVHGEHAHVTPALNFRTTRQSMPAIYLKLRDSHHYAVAVADNDS
jgi:hypothetical protein